MAGRRDSWPPKVNVAPPSPVVLPRADLPPPPPVPVISAPRTALKALAAASAFKSTTKTRTAEQTSPELASTNLQGAPPPPIDPRSPRIAAEPTQSKLFSTGPGSDSSQESNLAHAQIPPPEQQQTQPQSTPQRKPHIHPQQIPKPKVKRQQAQQPPQPKSQAQPKPQTRPKTQAHPQHGSSDILTE